MPAPELTRRDIDRRPSGLILVLHGGKADSFVPVDENSASWRRSNWMLGHISGRANAADVGVWLLRYGQRGWNERSASPPSPVPDARRALDEVRRQHGDVPVVLLGHSMGARTAVAVADDPSVTGVVALAPWLPSDQPFGPALRHPDRQASGRRARAPRQDHFGDAGRGLCTTSGVGRCFHRVQRHRPGGPLHVAAHLGMERLRGQQVARVRPAPRRPDGLILRA